MTLSLVKAIILLTLWTLGLAIYAFRKLSVPIHPPCAQCGHDELYHHEDYCFGGSVDKRVDCNCSRERYRPQ